MRCCTAAPRVQGAAQRGHGVLGMQEHGTRGALQTRDRSGLWRSRISGARRATPQSQIYWSGLRALVLHRIRDGCLHYTAHDSRFRGN